MASSLANASAAKFAYSSSLTRRDALCQQRKHVMNITKSGGVVTKMRRNLKKKKNVVCKSSSSTLKLSRMTQQAGVGRNDPEKAAEYEKFANLLGDYLFAFKVRKKKSLPVCFLFISSLVLGSFFLFVINETRRDVFF